MIRIARRNELEAQEGARAPWAQPSVTVYRLVSGKKGKTGLSCWTVGAAADLRSRQESGEARARPSCPSPTTVLSNELSSLEIPIHSLRAGPNDPAEKPFPPHLPRYVTPAIRRAGPPRDKVNKTNSGGAPWPDHLSLFPRKPRPPRPALSHPAKKLRRRCRRIAAEKGHVAKGHACRPHRDNRRANTRPCIDFFSFFLSFPRDCKKSRRS